MSKKTQPKILLKSQIFLLGKGEGEGNWGRGNTSLFYSPLRKKRKRHQQQNVKLKTNKKTKYCHQIYIKVKMYIR